MSAYYYQNVRGRQGCMCAASFPIMAHHQNGHAYTVYASSRDGLFSATKNRHGAPINECVNKFFDRRRTLVNTDNRTDVNTKEIL